MMKMFCITINDSHYEKIKNLGYIHGFGVILKIKILNDKIGANITTKIHFMENILFITGFGKSNEK